MRNSLIAIVGTTGVGKSDLGVQLAKTLRGEVINGDSMQAKEIHNRDRIPIIVGGTHYYIQSLLWKHTLVGDNEEEGLECEEILNAETEVLYKHLQEVDPVMSNRWHWNDRRKIRRSLQIYLQTGKPHSEWIKEQHQSEEETSLRFPRTCIFWLYADPKVLDKRLDERVDKMIERGLFSEIESMNNQVNEGKIMGKKIEFTRGIWQSIGYKEFEPYLIALKETEKKDDNKNIDNDIKDLNSLKKQCTENMKIATRRYSRYQIKWIRNRFLLKCYQSNNMNNGDIRIYLLNATSLENWKQEVCDKAISIAKEYLETGNGPDPISINPEYSELLITWTKYQCDVCTFFNENLPVIINGPYNWDQHLKSKWHKSNVKWKKEIDEKWNGDFPPWFKPRKNKVVNILVENASRSRIEIKTVNRLTEINWLIAVKQLTVFEAGYFIHSEKKYRDLTLDLQGQLGSLIDPKNKRIWRYKRNVFRRECSWGDINEDDILPGFTLDIEMIENALSQTPTPTETFELEIKFSECEESFTERHIFIIHYEKRQALKQKHKD
ncbi:4300_t:CDS:10 [Diversispora eburnea]|uniref:4300_t:CDS:1 n=1 Tax=Diversispora eburnea TaxID=1213867 RepID=A0A9N8Z2H1_9GLOM|nr:4300_t:CDS:10 [Diversispora eburnea]